MTTDPTYPIYSVHFRWTYDHTPTYHEPDPDLPEGRDWNSNGYTDMYKEDPGIEAVRAKAWEWWRWYVDRKKDDGTCVRDTNPFDVELTIKFVRRETWCLSWFAHWTFDVGQSDADAIGSFTLFVERMKDLNMRESVYTESGYLQEAYCLMGAEDHWRWYNNSDERGNPPCRCDGCKKNGRLVICH